MKYSPLLFILLITPWFASAELAYSPIVGLPGVDPANTDLEGLVNGLYALSISIAALLAVIKIVIAGVKWMMTDIVTSKSAAKSEIKGALFGLLIVLGAVLILTEINPNLTGINVDLKDTTIIGSGESTETKITLADAVSATQIKNGISYIPLTLIGGATTEDLNKQKLHAAYCLSLKKSNPGQWSAEETNGRSRCIPINSNLEYVTNSNNELRSACESNRTLEDNVVAVKAGRYLEDPEFPELGFCIQHRND